MKRICSLILTMTMLVSSIMTLSVSADFALDNGEEGRDILCSHIEFTEDVRYEGAKGEEVEVPVMYARTIVRDLNTDTASGTKAKDVTLICAGYDANGVLVDVDMSSGMNTLLKAGIDEEGVEKYKAYVWDNENMKPLTAVNKYDTALSDLNLDIKFEGKDFASYIGSAFDKDTYTYTKAIEMPSGDTIELPEVTAEVTGGNGWATVVGDPDALTTTITLYYGQRTETGTQTPTTDDTTPEVTYYDYSWSDKKVYTITYTLPDQSDALGMDDVNYVTDQSNGRYGTSQSLKYKRVRAYTGVETAKLVEFSNLKNYSIVILKPTDEKTGSVVAKDSTDAAIDNWTNAECSDSTAEVVAYTDTGGTERLKSAKVVTYDGTANSLWVYDKVTNYNDYNPGTMAFSNRNMSYGGQFFAIETLPDELQGCEYIVFPYGSNKTASFYIRRDCEVIAYAANSDAFGDVAGSADTVTWGTVETLTSGIPAITYLNNYIKGAVSKVVLMKQYGYKEEDFYQNTAGTKIYPASRQIDHKIKTDLGYTGTGKVPYWEFKTTDDAEKDAELAALTEAEILARWEKTVDKNMLVGYGNLSTPNIGSTSYMKTTLPLPASNTNRTIFADRSGLTQANYTGLLVGYGDALELDGAVVFGPGASWTAAGSGGNANDTALAFEAERDLEVLIVNINGATSTSAVPSDWIPITNVDDDTAIRAVNDPNQIFAGTQMWVKKFEKGQTLDLKTNQITKRCIVIVRPITSR